jgi:hypothetical protein
MKNTKLMGLTVAVVITTTMMLSATLSVTDVFASYNEWGDLSSDMGQAGKMGEHASDPDHDGEKGQDPDHSPRQGVGNLDLDDDGERDHPSESADTLRGICEGITGDDPRCP